jgi:hypothetical protein
MYAGQERERMCVSKQQQHYGPNHLHYLTTSIPQAGIVPPSVDAGWRRAQPCDSWERELGYRCVAGRYEDFEEKSLSIESRSHRSTCGRAVGKRLGLGSADPR